MRISSLILTYIFIILTGLNAQKPAATSIKQLMKDADIPGMSLATFKGENIQFFEYGFKNIFMLRGGYTYESGIWDDITSSERTNVNSGLSAGLSVALPLDKEKGTYIGIDYAFRQTVSFNNNHTIGIILNF